jgi:hypothetical protein
VNVIRRKSFNTVGRVLKHGERNIQSVIAVVKRHKEEIIRRRDAPVALFGERCILNGPLPLSGHGQKNILINV